MDPNDMQAALDAAEAARTEAWRMGTTLAVRQAAGQLGADGGALLDSVRFLDTLDDLVDEDASTPEFAAVIAERVRAAVSPGARAAEPAAPGVDYRTADQAAFVDELARHRLRPNPYGTASGGPARMAEPNGRTEEYYEAERQRLGIRLPKRHGL